MFKKIPLWPILLVALALRVPGWFTQDDKSKYGLFEHDEYQYVEIAVSLNQELDTTLFTDLDAEKYIYNARGFGMQVGWLAFFYHNLNGAKLDTTTLVMIGRGLSTLYALLLIVLVFRLSLYIFQDRSIAWLAALFLSIFDLNVTYSHYGIPAISYVFWNFLTIFLLVQWYDGLKKERKWQSLSFILVISFSIAMTFATKFDFIPVLMGGLILATAIYQKKLSFLKAILLSLSFGLLFVFFFGLITAFTLSFEEVKHSFNFLYKGNKDVIGLDQHLLYNPFLYLMAVIGGTSLPVFLAGMYGLYILLKKRQSTPFPFGLTIFLIFLSLEFLVRWNLDTPFVRRGNIFMPMMAMLAAYGTIFFSNRLKKTAWLPLGLVLVYTLVLTLVSQSNAWNDTRYRAKQFLNSEDQAGKKFSYSPYVSFPGMPKSYLKKESDLVLLHETYYGRYWKYFTTPFKYPPKCCEEVYHCFGGAEECESYQALLSGEDKAFELLKIIPTREIMPERLLYKHLFGSYETFLGDIRIYQRKN